MAKVLHPGLVHQRVNYLVEFAKSFGFHLITLATEENEKGSLLTMSFSWIEPEFQIPQPGAEIQQQPPEKRKDPLGTLDD